MAKEFVKDLTKDKACPNGLKPFCNDESLKQSIKEKQKILSKNLTVKK